MRRFTQLPLSLLITGVLSGFATGQDSRLLNKPIVQGQRGPVGPTIDNVSWITVPLPPPREVKVHDKVTVRVDLAARTVQEGEFQGRKNATYDALLRSFVVLEGLTQVKNAPQSSGDQRIQGQLNSQNRTTAELETSESLKFEIGAEIAAILPNGDFVLEAHREVQINEEVWLHSLSGVCPKDALGPGNVVLSKDIAQLKVTKKELGQVPDNYRRGWFQRWWDRLKVF
jgi:flagellar L-ring protein FlgH